MLDNRTLKIGVLPIPWLIWLCFILRGLFYSVVFPIWEGYDEYAHFAFIQHVIYPGGLPGIHAQVSREIEESLSLAPVPWLLRSEFSEVLPHDSYWKLKDSERSRRQQELRLLSPALSRLPATKSLPIYEAKQPPLYYWLLSLPLRLVGKAPLTVRIFFLRWISILLVSVFIPLGILIAQLVFGDRRIALTIVALSVSMPELIIDIARVSNECLGLAVYCLIIYFALRYAKTPQDIKIAAMLGFSLGLGLLAKSYFLTAAAAITCVAATALVKRIRAIQNISVIAFLSLLISAWWYAGNNALGEWSGSTISTLIGNIRRVNWYSTVDSILLSHIWFGNWSFLQLRSWIYHVMGIVFIAALAGILLLAIRRLRKQAPPPFLSTWQSLAVMATIYLFFIVGLLYFALVTYTYTGVSGIPGWYMYCLVSAESILLGLGLFALFPRCCKNWIIPVVTTLYCLLDLYGMHFLLVPYYTGIIAHKSNGALATFHVEQFRFFGIALHRLQVNRPEFLGPGVIFAIWCLYLIATVSLTIISFRLARISRQDSPREQTVSQFTA